jgi:hypothetical protein
MDNETQIQIDTLRGELREEKGVVEALEESKRCAGEILSKKIAELTKEKEGLDALRGELRGLRKLRRVAEMAMNEIDGIFKFFLVSGLSEEGGGLPLYEQSKGLAEARASIAAALAASQETTQNTEEDRDG